MPFVHFMREKPLDVVQPPAMTGKRTRNLLEMLQHSQFVFPISSPPPPEVPAICRMGRVHRALHSSVGISMYLCTFYEQNMCGGCSIFFGMHGLLSNLALLCKSNFSPVFGLAGTAPAGTALLAHNSFQLTCLFTIAGIMQ